jgi:hypothetical protein
VRTDPGKSITAQAFLFNVAEIKNIPLLLLVLHGCHWMACLELARRGCGEAWKLFSEVGKPWVLRADFAWKNGVAASIKREEA